VKQELRVWWSEPQSNIFEMGHYDSRFASLKSHSFDPAALWERLGGDVELLRDLVAIFCEEYPTLLENLRAAIEQHSFSNVQKFSHKLKGSALQFSGASVAKLATFLEEMGESHSLDGAPRIFARLQQEVADLVRSLRAMASEKPIG
jgi:HPt (histidine-containing phosphotransfer) domain-containing protein